jgi:hypothetical protein
MNEIKNELLSYHPNSKKKYEKAKVYSGVKQYIQGYIKAEELSSMKKFTFERSKTKVIDRSPPSLNTPGPFPSPDNLKTINNNLQKVDNNQDSFRIKDNNKKNIFISQKSFNLAKDDSMNKKLSSKEINQKINFKLEAQGLKKNTIQRKKTFNYLNKLLIDDSKSNQKEEGNQINIKDNDEDKNSNINKNFDDNSSTYQKESLPNSKEIFSMSPTDNLNSSRKQKMSFIIKEEDENLSEHSVKNTEANNTKKNER